MQKFFLPLFLSVSSFVFSQTDPAALKKVYADSISTAILKKNLSVLASDDYEGRETGKPGQEKAAEYIAGQFKSFGLSPQKDGTYFQKFDVYPKNPPGTVITIGKKEFVLLKDFYVSHGSGVDPVSAAEIDFAGFGIEDNTYSDYKDLTVKDRIVMFLEGEPMKDSISLVTGSAEKSKWSADPAEKVKKAKEKGAKAVFIIDENFDANAGGKKFYVEHSPLGLEKPVAEGIPVIHISKTMASVIFDEANSSASPESIRKKIVKTRKTISLVALVPVKIDFHYDQAILHSCNVLGFMEGSDLKNEILVISAHYDHLGIIDGKIYNGADDDGSGTVSVIELARVFSEAKKQGHGPRRSILFMTFAGEEKGLLGSKHYTSDPEYPLLSTVCDLNIDMVGRIDKDHAADTNYVYVIGSAMLSTTLKEINEANNKQYAHLDLDYKYDDPADKNHFYYRSDHYNFARNKIPVIFFFNGTHDDYHKETDEINKISFPLIAERDKLVFLTAWDVANRDERLKVNVVQPDQQK